MTVTAVARRRRAVAVGLALTVVAAGAVALDAWFIGYLDRFLHSPINQPQDVAVLDDGGLLIKGVGGVARLAPDGAVAWQRPGASDAILPWPNGSALLLLGAEEQVVLLGPDGRVARTLDVPRDAPFGAACRLGMAAADSAGRLYLLAERPPALHELTLDGDRLRDEVRWTADRRPPAYPNPTAFLSLACAKDGTVWLAGRTQNGALSFTRISRDGVLLGDTAEIDRLPDERWRLAAGLDGALYCAATQIAAGRLARWRVRTMRGEETADLFTKSAADHDCPATINPRFAVDAAGNLYVADLANFRVSVFAPSGRLLRTIPANTWYRGLAIRLIRRQHHPA